ncbi:MAG: DsbE family thiol:disulfide interchange protein [Hyphomicrobiaceae bacterium]|nr:DsbE family thiol:disulfide interchange protein [Hyphomicrobiaceae bacterium]
MTSSTNEAGSVRPLVSWRMALPLILFLALAGLFFVGLYSGDPSKLPSALIGKPVPEFTLPPLKGLKHDGKQVAGLKSADLKGKGVQIVNFWASWCLPCRDEHPFLEQLAKESKARLVGINYKDKTSAARRFLGQLGNPFDAVGVDTKGSAAINWGVYGMPETFIVGNDGTILYKHVGPIGAKTLTDDLLPAIRNARSKGS